MSIWSKEIIRVDGDLKCYVGVQDVKHISPDHYLMIRTDTVGLCLDLDDFFPTNQEKLRKLMKFIEISDENYKAYEHIVEYLKGTCADLHAQNNYKLEMRLIKNLKFIDNWVEKSNAFKRYNMTEERWENNHE